MSKVSIIVAIAQNNAIGKNNDLIWHLPADLKRFKTITSGHPIIMGRNTFESIGKPLPNRTSIIVTRSTDYHVEGCLTASSTEDAIEQAKQLDDEIFIIGGAQIYKEVLDKNLATQLDVTLVHHTFEADVFFPEINLDSWEEIAREDLLKGENNPYDYSFISYNRR